MVTEGELKLMIKGMLAEIHNEGGSSNRSVDLTSEHLSHLMNHALECKDGHCKIRDTFFDKVRNMVKNADFECADCGYPLIGSLHEIKEKIPKCPRCGHSHAKQRRRQTPEELLKGALL